MAVQSIETRQCWLYSCLWPVTCVRQLWRLYRDGDSLTASSLWPPGSLLLWLPQLYRSLAGHKMGLWLQLQLELWLELWLWLRLLM